MVYGVNKMDFLVQNSLQNMNTQTQPTQTVGQADKKLLIGRSLTRGLGCGGFPQKGYEAAKEQMSEIKQMMRGSDMVFITAGMGGGTGTGCAPVVAKIAKEEGAIVI